MPEHNFEKEETYWREKHREQPYARSDFDFDQYLPAYRTGVEGFGKYSGREYEDVEDDLALDYEQNRAGSALPWDHARHAVQAAWAKLSNDVTGLDRDRGIRSGM